MRDLWATVASAFLGAGLAAATITGLTIPSGEPFGIFWICMLLLSPVAIFGASQLCSQLLTSASQREIYPHLLLDAHLMGLGYSALMLVLFLLTAGLIFDLTLRIVAVSMAAGIAGGLGLAWGALVCLPETD